MSQMHPELEDERFSLRKYFDQVYAEAHERMLAVLRRKARRDRQRPANDIEEAEIETFGPENFKRSRCAG